MAMGVPCHHVVPRASPQQYVRASNHRGHPPRGVLSSAWFRVVVVPIGVPLGCTRLRAKPPQSGRCLLTARPRMFDKPLSTPPRSDWDGGLTRTWQSDMDAVSHSMGGAWGGDDSDSDMDLGRHAFQNDDNQREDEVRILLWQV